ncbi:FAD-linked oxidase-like protein [Thozetella sp. PMI_491]|nr:FAD-linked oxidase-like protein [Thozetella sp. PMI_491]
MSAQLPSKYHDPEYQEAHRGVFDHPSRRPILKVLPPGVGEEDFARAIEEFVTVVGRDFVFVDEALSDYIDPYDPYQDDPEKRKTPSAAVCPSSTDELQAVLSVANKYKIPLWTFSRGKNLGYGGPAPRVSGSVSLDLHRMNKIIEVNEKFAYAVVEPGVTFTDLYDYCIEHKLKVWPSLPSLGWGSVIGNTLDRGMGFGANFSHHQAMSGIEVMLADGSLLRTGQWGITNSPNAFLSKYTYGPSVEGLFVQSNLGVVTKLSLWMNAQPPAYMSCEFSMPAFEDLAVMVDELGKLRRDGIVPNCIWFMGLIENLCMWGRREDFWKGEGPIPDSRMDELQAEYGGYQWLARWGLYGPKRIIQAQFDEIKEILAGKAPTGKLVGNIFVGEEGAGVDASTIPIEHGMMWAGVPSLASLELVHWTIPHDRTGKGKPAHGDYAPIIPNDGATVLEWMRACKPIHEAHGLEPMVDFFMYERHVVVMNMFSWDQEDPEAQKRVRGLYYGLHEEAKKRGFGMYRSHVHHMDLIAGLNDFNGHMYNKFVEKIKDALDPEGILAPGKSGIWPERFRHLRNSPE